MYKTPTQGYQMLEDMLIHNIDWTLDRRANTRASSRVTKGKKLKKKKEDLSKCTYVLPIKDDPGSYDILFSIANYSGIALANSGAALNLMHGAIGALDGTLIHAIVPLNQQARYRGRGDCFQNVLGMCNFNMILTYVWAGWEGIIHDARVLREVAFDPNSRFMFPPSIMYHPFLINIIFVMLQIPIPMDFLLVIAIPFEEKFNHVHAQLGNVIERTYSVLKVRFSIPKQMAFYPFPKQIKVVVACFAIHNFIIRCNIQDQLFMEYEENACLLWKKNMEETLRKKSLNMNGVSLVHYSPKHQTPQMLIRQDNYAYEVLVLVVQRDFFLQPYSSMRDDHGSLYEQSVHKSELSKLSVNICTSSSQQMSSSSTDIHGKTSRRRKKPAVDLKDKSTEHYVHQSGVTSFQYTASVVRLQVK
ncbi:hypothetical protein OSB04_017099 [Centaurea solstitialis]|uniref:DDE Tnp4 domain-containing protein n=1 Tax=Centaurea solstitialis TaxID=347529 RepID=A0AA38WKE5_9ASTR|nr:hypothetical protein OSB04_017099 [Centaurea solstitialis]